MPRPATPILLPYKQPSVVAPNSDRVNIVPRSWCRRVCNFVARAPWAILINGTVLSKTDGAGKGGKGPGKMVQNKVEQSRTEWSRAKQGRVE